MAILELTKTIFIEKRSYRYEKTNDEVVLEY